MPEGHTIHALARRLDDAFTGTAPSLRDPDTDPAPEGARAVTDRQKLVEKLGKLAADLDAHIVTAESLTSGAIASALGQGPEASEWFRGGVIAYQPEVKFEVLGVPEGPVVTEQAAEQMARGARKLLSANWAIAVTGVGGPGSDEGEPAGTVWMAVVTDDHVTTRKVQLDGDPGEVVEKTVDVSLELLHEVLEKG